VWACGQGGCQPGVMVLMDLYGKLMLSGTSWETLMDGGLFPDDGTVFSLTSTLREVHGEFIPVNASCA